MLELINDIKFQSFKQSFENGNFDFNFDSDITELQNLHTIRKIRLISTENILTNISEVIDCIRENQANRSRCVEIKMRASRLKLNIEYKIENISNYLKVKYKNELKSEFSTQADRNSCVKDLFSFTQDCINNMSNIINFCDLIINDLDQTYWSYKTIVDCLKITDEAKRITI